VADPPLDHRRRELVDMHIMHDVAVAKRVDSQLMESTTSAVTAILAVKPSQVDVSLEELTQAIL
jgi:hypothetical protein